MVQAESYHDLSNDVVKQPLGSGLQGVIVATKNTFLHFHEVSQKADRPQSKSLPPRSRSSGSEKSLSLFGNPCKCATLPELPPPVFSEMAIASTPVPPVQQIVQVARRCHVKDKASNSMSSKTEAEAPITHQDYRRNLANSLTDSSSSDCKDIAAAHELAGTATEYDNGELLTVMLRNIPCRCTHQDILDLLTHHGWADSCNFFRLPMPRGRCKGNLGYAFIGFPTTELTQEFMLSMKGVEFCSRRSTKVLDVTPARIQGLNNNLALTGEHAARAVDRMRDSNRQADVVQEAFEAFTVPSMAKGSLNQQGRGSFCGQRTWEQNSKRNKNAKFRHV